VLTSDGETVVPYRAIEVACFVYSVTFRDPWNITNMVSPEFTPKYIQLVALTIAV